MQTSEHLNELATALAKAQAHIQNAHKDAKNPFFNSKYADLASVWDACRKPLTDQGLSVVQTLSSSDGIIICTTMLLHGSGQFIRSEFAMRPIDAKPQTAGSTATYLRRYSLQAVVGIAPEDDDGNAASGKSEPRPLIHTATGDRSNEKVQAVVEHVQKVAAAKAAPVQLFSASNKTQTKFVEGFLLKKNAINRFTEIIVAMEGRPSTIPMLEQVFQELESKSQS